MAPSAISPYYTSTIETTSPEILELRRTLNCETEPLARRFRALFSLKHIGSQDPRTSPDALAAVSAIAAAFPSPSALLKHELAYCLGQTRNLAAVPILRTVLQNHAEDPMCRHEAAEALGALGDADSLELLKRFRDNEGEYTVIRETCEVAVERILWETGKGKEEKLQQSDFSSIDPAPPMEQTQSQTVMELEKALMDSATPLFLRYRAMFALRDLASPPDLPTAIPAIHALGKGFADPSALFRHEIAFVFGQISHPASIPALTRVLSNTKEESMVRHEAAEALGSLGDEQGVEDILKRFIDDEEQVVRESIVVALDMAAFEKGGEIEYAL